MFIVSAPGQNEQFGVGRYISLQKYKTNLKMYLSGSYVLALFHK